MVLWNAEKPMGGAGTASAKLLRNDIEVRHVRWLKELKVTKIKPVTLAELGKSFGANKQW